jgi:hypothetical protein
MPADRLESVGKLADVLRKATLSVLRGKIVRLGDQGTPDAIECSQAGQPSA